MHRSIYWLKVCDPRFYPFYQCCAISLGGTLLFFDLIGGGVAVWPPRPPISCLFAFGTSGTFFERTFSVRETSLPPIILFLSCGFKMIEGRFFVSSRSVALHWGYLFVSLYTCLYTHPTINKAQVQCFIMVITQKHKIHSENLRNYIFWEKVLVLQLSPRVGGGGGGGLRNGSTWM